MRSFYIALLALVAVAAAVPQVPKQKAADQDLLKKQLDVIGLLESITDEIPNEQLNTLGHTWDIESNWHQYDEPSVVKYYYGLVNSGNVQPKGTVFSVSIDQLRKEVAFLTRMFISAKDYPTFLATAAWARVHVNEHQFIKAFTSAILQRHDTQGIILPAPYEIFPQYYFDSRIIQEAKNIQNKGIESLGGAQTYVIPANYSANLHHGEHQLSYFTQDIGLAAWYAYVQLAGYMIPQQQQQSGAYKHSGNEHDVNGHGSHYYYLHQQLLARYHLESLSNGLGHIEDIHYNKINTPYQPHLSYANGLEFVGRPEHLNLDMENHHLVKYIYILEQRLINAIDQGHVITPQGAFLSLYQPQGLDILGELIQGTGRSINPRYYGSLQAAARQLLGNAPHAYDIYGYTPAPLELGQTAVKDPVFYKLYKKIINLFQHYQQSLPAYQYNDVVFQGVQIEKVDVSKMVTYFDEVMVNLDNAVPSSGSQQIHIAAAVKRLNHKPYEYKIVVQSENQIANAVVRVYLGPKYNHHGQPININEHRLEFVELDQFVYDLQQGQTIIVRNSQQFPSQSIDHPTVQQIKNGVNGAISSQNPLYITEPQQIFGFPARLSLPKGQTNGFPLQLLVVISSPTGYESAYGPVIPEAVQNYQPHTYQIVQSEEYPQYAQGQGPKVSGSYMNVEVVPNYYSGAQSHHSGKYQYGSWYHSSPKQYPYAHPQYWQHAYGQQYGYGSHAGQYYSHGQQGVAGQQEYAGQQQQGAAGQHYAGHQAGQVPYSGQQQQWVSGQQYQHGHYAQPQYVAHGHQHQYQGQVHQPQGMIHQQGVAGGVEGQWVGGKYQSIQQGAQGINPMYQTHGAQGIQGVQGGVQGAFQGIPQQVQQGQLKAQSEYLDQYYSGKHISNIIGGAISLDGRPLGYPLERPLAPSAFYVGNIHVVDVLVYHEEQHYAGQYNL